MNKLLSEGLDFLDLSLSDEQINKLNRFISELELFNPIYKLVNYETEDELIIKHFLDCLAGVKIIKEKLKDGELADFGTGAGFPGIILAIVFENNKIYLVERMKRRVDFLRNVLLSCGINNAEIILADTKDINQKFDVITCRAFHPLYDIISDVDRLLKKEGTLCAYKARRSYIEAELEEITGFSAEIKNIRVPFLDENRIMCSLKREEL